MTARQFVTLLIKKLETPTVQKNGSAIADDFACHFDIPGDPALGHDFSFIACGEDETETFLISVLKVKT